MKKKKIVHMQCNRCREVYGPEPIIILNSQTKESRMKMVLPRRCRVCGGGLQRSVVEVEAEHLGMLKIPESITRVIK